jgi:hypothetical protein
MLSLNDTQITFFFLYIFRFFCVYCVSLPPLRGQHIVPVLCHPRWLPTSGLTEFAMCWGGAGLNPGLLISSQVRYHWATSPPNTQITGYTPIVTFYDVMLPFLPKLSFLAKIIFGWVGGGWGCEEYRVKNWEGGETCKKSKRGKYLVKC